MEVKTLNHLNLNQYHHPHVNKINIDIDQKKAPLISERIHHEIDRQ
jgi:hypothetical protein